MIYLIVIIGAMSILSIMAVPITERLAESLGIKIAAFFRPKNLNRAKIKEKILSMLNQCNLEDRVYLYPTHKGYESLINELSEEGLGQVKNAMADLILEYFPKG